MNFFIKYKYYMIIALIIIVSIFSYYIKQNQEVKSNETKPIFAQEQKQTSENCVVDIKGQVKNPGVYKVSCQKNINDVITLAGGLSKKATTDNINLSRKLSDQMVIIISTTKALTNQTIAITKECQTTDYIITNCLPTNVITIPENSQEKVNSQNPNDNNQPVIDQNNNVDIENTNNSPKIISINSASKEELMTLPGIGESKATNIINYRTSNGPFVTINDIMNVSGIGEAIFAQIKALITI